MQHDLHLHDCSMCVYACCSPLVHTGETAGMCLCVDMQMLDVVT